MRLVLRTAAAGCGVALGWLLQMIAYLATAPGAGPQDVRLWAAYSAAYCGAALLFVGVPVAAADPRAVRSRPLRSILLAGCAGAALALTPPAIAAFVLAVPLAFVAGAVAMWTYVALTSLFPRVFGCETDN